LAPIQTSDVIRKGNTSKDTEIKEQITVHTSAFIALINQPMLYIPIIRGIGRLLDYNFVSINITAVIGPRAARGSPI